MNHGAVRWRTRTEGRNWRLAAAACAALLLLLLAPAAGQPIDGEGALLFQCSERMHTFLLAGLTSCTTCSLPRHVGSTRVACSSDGARPPGPPSPPPLAEVAVLRHLRSVLWNATPGWDFRLSGWHPDDESHPCQWTSVHCNAQKHITDV